jgi:hypothetical protein
MGLWFTGYLQSLSTFFQTHPHTGWIVAIIGLPLTILNAFVTCRMKFVFDKKLCDLKWKQETDLSKTQADFDHLNNRSSLSNDQEYKSVTKTWNAIIDAIESATWAAHHALGKSQIDCVPDEQLARTNDFSRWYPFCDKR